MQAGPGHLFEDLSLRGHSDIKSTLEDLANRHPEFADQLRYPAWGNDARGNTNNWDRKRRGSEQGEGETSRQPQPESRDPSEPESEENPVRGRPKDNLRNTVPDMGQKQQQEAEDKESRGQRSWSAPPDNRAQQQEKPRFVSKIEITPVNPDAPPAPTGDAAKPPMAPPKPQPQQQPSQAPPQSQSKSNVRHIPIFVEGRDEPVLPKNVEPEFTQTQAPPPQHFSRPAPHFLTSQQFQQEIRDLHPPPRKQTPPHFEQHSATPRYEQHSQPPRYEQQNQPPPQPKPEPPPPPPQQPEPPVANLRDPLYKVSCVQKEVDDLKGQIENFSAPTRADKQYILLDELLTRNLIKLDNVDTEGREEVRNARKNAIKSIQRCISMLEQNVPAANSGKEGSPMDAEPTPENDQGNQTSRSASKQELATEASVNQMEVDNRNPQENTNNGQLGDSEMPSLENNRVTSSEPSENKTA